MASHRPGEQLLPRPCWMCHLQGIHQTNTKAFALDLVNPRVPEVPGNFLPGSEEQ